MRVLGGRRGGRLVRASRLARLLARGERLARLLAPRRGQLCALARRLRLHGEPLDPRQRGLELCAAALEEPLRLAGVRVEVVDRIQPCAGCRLGGLGIGRRVARRAEPAVELVLRHGQLARVGCLLRLVEEPVQGVVGALRLAKRLGGGARVLARGGGQRAAFLDEQAWRVAGVRRDRSPGGSAGRLVRRCLAPVRRARSIGTAMAPPARVGRGSATGGRGRTASPAAVAPTSTALTRGAWGVGVAGDGRHGTARSARSRSVSGATGRGRRGRRGVRDRRAPRQPRRAGTAPRHHHPGGGRVLARGGRRRALGRLGGGPARLRAPRPARRGRPGRTPPPGRGRRPPSRGRRRRRWNGRSDRDGDRRRRRRRRGGAVGDGVGPSFQAPSSGEPGIGPVPAARDGSESVVLRRGLTEFGEIVTRTSPRGAGRARRPSAMAAPTAAPTIRPMARKAISDGLT